MCMVPLFVFSLADEYRADFYFCVSLTKLPVRKILASGSHHITKWQ
jgi:hypothetical protein